MERAISLSSMIMERTTKRGVVFSLKTLGRSMAPLYTGMNHAMLVIFAR